MGWWAAVVALVAATAAYAECVRAARTYGLLVEAAFDVHLPLLYRAARLPAPASAAEEQAYGDRLSRYLCDGSDDPAIVFVAAAEGATDETTA